MMMITVWAKVLPRCMVILLLVVLPDWFWCRSVFPLSCLLVSVSVSQVCTCLVAMPAPDSTFGLV